MFFFKLQICFLLFVAFLISAHSLPLMGYAVDPEETDWMFLRDQRSFPEFGRLRSVWAKNHALQRLIADQKDGRY